MSCFVSIEIADMFSSNFHVTFQRLELISSTFICLETISICQIITLQCSMILLDVFRLNNSIHVMICLNSVKAAQ